MIIKEADNQDYKIAELTKLLGYKLTRQQKADIRKEISTVRAGIGGEKEAAYHINFFFGASNYHVIIHDLRLEHGKQVAQIDHLLISRFMEAYVIETKHFNHGIRINENGEFDMWNGKAFQGIPSPLEQNERHINVLKKVIEESDILPKRLGISIPLEYRNYVLVSPKSRIDRPKGGFDTSCVIKADAFRTAINRKIDADWKIYKVGKLISSDTLFDIGTRIAELHRPVEMDYAARFGIDITREPERLASPMRKSRGKEEVCRDCGTPLESKVIFFCRLKKDRFKGKLLCRNCQKAYP